MAMNAVGWELDLRIRREMRLAIFIANTVLLAKFAEPSLNPEFVCVRRTLACLVKFKAPKFLLNGIFELFLELSG